MKQQNNDYTYLHTADGATPLSIADAVTRELGDNRDILLDVIFYLNVYLDREFKEIVENDKIFMEAAEKEDNENED